MNAPTPPSPEAVLEPKTLPLSKGKAAIVDAIDYPWLNQWKWHAGQSGGGNWYALRNQGGKTIRMHRELLELKKNQVGDHINGDGLDNRRANLRICTQAQNNQNMKKKANTVSRFKGVSFNKETSKWIAQISYKTKMYGLGYFLDEEDAAIVYDVAAQLLFGEYARLNFSQTLPYPPPPSK